MKDIEIRIKGIDKPIIINEDIENLMICRIVEEGKPDKIALVRDIFGDGTLVENEIRIDEKYYNEKEGLKRLEELSKKLNLEIF